MLTDRMVSSVPTMRSTSHCEFMSEPGGIVCGQRGQLVGSGVSATSKKHMGRGCGEGDGVQVNGA